MARIVGDDTVTESEVMALADANLSPRAGAAWHLLCHWIADAEIRAKDPEYGAGQLKEIQSCLAELQRG